MHALSILAMLAVQATVVLTDVTWNSPAAGDVYIPGDTLQAVWTSPDKVVSPSFTICAVDNSTSTTDNTDCGTAVWPPINQNGTEYSISLAVPNITGDGEYCLVMKDDAGKVYDTPNFSLALTKDTNTTVSANVTSGSTPQSTSTSIAYLPSRRAPTAAAIAIPLALVAATLLGALLLLLCRARRFRQREKDKQKEFRAAEKLGSRASTMSFASATDIERAVWALAASRGYNGLGPHPYAAQAPHAPLGMSMGMGGPGIGAATAAALGMGAFGWAHAGLGQPSYAAPGMSDVYTPAPVPKYATSPSTASSGTQPNAPHAARHYANVPLEAHGQSRQEVTHHAQETAPRRVNWNDTDWRSTDRMFADDAERTVSQSSGPPQLPAIQLHASSPPPHVQLQHSPPPPLPPKQLFPGSSHTHAPRAYTPPYGADPAAESRLPQTPGTDADASLSVISSYMQASPAVPQGQFLAPPNASAYAQDVLAVRAPPASVTRTRSLRRLETLPEHAGEENMLPVRPEERVGTDLYDAVSRAVAR